MEQQQPGQTIVPHSEGSEPQNVVPQAATPPATQWQFKNDAAAPPVTMAGGEAAPSANPHRPVEDSFKWTASEFVEHSKNTGWYMGLGAGALLIAVIIFLVTRDKISTAVVIVAAVVLAIAAARKPRVLEYQVDDEGLSVGPKLYSYEQFKSFSIIDEGVVPSIYLMPIKRFQVSLTIYFAPADEDAIVGILSDRLPLEDRQLDPVDRFMHRIRF
jgi:hypothetical protein